MFSVAFALNNNSSGNGTQPDGNATSWDDIVNYVTTSITITGSLFIIVCFVFIRVLRKHPNSMLFWNAICDLSFNVFLLVMPFVRQDFFPQGSLACKFVASVHQFLSIASVSWNMMISLDLLLLLRSPFHAGSGYIKFFNYGVPSWIIYHLFVWGLSIITSPWFMLDESVILENSMYVTLGYMMEK